MINQETHFNLLDVPASGAKTHASPIWLWWRR